MNQARIDAPDGPGWPAGTGEMAERIRAHEWVATALGPIENWPQSLRTIVDLMLASPTAMIALWGPDLVQIYNDAYRIVMAAKHPAGLGQPTRECWPEVWDFNAPSYEAVFAGEARSFKDQTLTIERHGVPEHACFDLTYCPLRDETGTVAGVLVTVVETTSRVLAEERRQFRLELEARLRALRSPKDVLAAASEALGRQLGAGQVAYAEVDDVGKFAIIELDWTDGSIPSKSSRYPIEEAGSALLTDLERGELVAIADVRDDPRTSSPVTLARFDRASIAALLNVPLVKGGRLVAVLAIYSRDPRAWAAADIALAEQAAERTWAAFGRARAEQALAEELQAMTRLHELSSLALRADFPTLLEAILDAAIELHDADFGNIQLYNPESNFLRIAAQRGFEKPFLEHFDTVNASDFSACGIALAKRERVMVEDVEGEPAYAPSLKTAREAGYCAVQSTPLLSSSGQPLGMLSTHFRKPRSLSERECRLTDVYARLAGDAIAAHLLEQALHQSAERFRVLVESSAQAVWETNPEGVVVVDLPSWRAFTGQTVEEWLGCGWLDAVHPDDWEDAKRQWLKAIAAGQDVNAEFRLRSLQEGYSWTNLRAAPVRQADGSIQRWVAMNIDITERKQSEEHRKLLIGELDHRVKNTLAIVQAVARQTFKGAVTASEASVDFQGRLMALAAAHNLLTQSQWEKASLEEVAFNTLEGNSGNADRIVIVGPKVILQPKQAVTIAMALHELHTNAVKHGALSNEGGRVRFEWDIRGCGDLRLKLVWREQGGPPVKPPLRRGFGSQMIEYALAQELRGVVAMKFNPEGLVCTIDAALPGLVEAAP